MQRPLALVVVGGMLLAPILVLFVPFGLALWAWRRGARTSLGFLIGGALVLHVLLLFAPPPQSQDLYQYLFYGRMQMLHPPSGVGQMLILHGANPYVVQPSTVYSWVCPGSGCRTNSDRPSGSDGRYRRR